MKPGQIKRLGLVSGVALALAALAVGPTLADPAASASLGKTLFKANCASCHGPAGKGDGPAGRLLPTRPANLSASKAPDDYLKMMIAEGGDAMGRSAAMPPWGAILNSAQIDSVILHINTLRPPLK